MMEDNLLNDGFYKPIGDLEQDASALIESDSFNLEEYNKNYLPRRIEIELKIIM